MSYLRLCLKNKNRTIKHELLFYLALTNDRVILDEG